MEKKISEEEGLRKAIAKVEKEKKMLKRKHDRIVEKHQLEQDLELSEDEEERTEVKKVVKVKEELKFFTYLVENQETLESNIMSEVKEEVMDTEEVEEDEEGDNNEKKDSSSDLDDQLDKIIKKQSVNLWAKFDQESDPDDQDEGEEYKGEETEEKDGKPKVEATENLKEESKVSVVVRSEKEGFEKITIRASRSRTMGKVKRKYMKSMELRPGSSVTFLTPSSIEVADLTAIGLLGGLTLTAIIKETAD